MVESIILLLIYIGIIVALVYVVIWFVQDILGVPLPPRVVTIAWAITALVVLLLIYKAVAPHLGAIHI